MQRFLICFLKWNFTLENITLSSHNKTYKCALMTFVERACIQRYTGKGIFEHFISVFFHLWGQYSFIQYLFNMGQFFPRPIRLRISRATIHFFIFVVVSQTFCLTKAYNLCHQVALVDGPMRREVAIRWTNRKRAGVVLASVTQIEMHKIRRCFRRR